MLRLAAVAQGAGPDADLAQADDLVAAGLAGQLAKRPTARTGDRDVPQLLAALEPRRGAERLVDLMLRSGPYGDAFGDDPDGWSLDPDDAARWGVTHQGHAQVTSATGRVEVAVEVTDDIRPGVVSLPHGFGHDLDGIEQSVASARPGVNVNVVVDTVTIDPLSGTAGLTAVPVQVGPV